MAELVSTHESESKVKMKDAYDKKSKPRELDAGSMVLMRVPGFIGKLDDSWDGPYEVVDKILPLTYQLAVISPNGAYQHAQTVPDTRMLRVAIADVDEQKDGHRTETHQDEEVLNTEQRKGLVEKKFTFKDVIKPTPRRVHLLQHSTNTSESLPIWTASLRLPVKWKDQLHTEVRDLLEVGIIRVSHNPWLSPIALVRKKEVSIVRGFPSNQPSDCSKPLPYSSGV